MNIKLHFLGAARSVTGSSYLLETPDQRLLIDCGYFQERNFQDRNWDEFPVDPKTIDAVLLTHAHLDHCGLLPKLVKEGFTGPIHCTAASASIAQIIVEDSARIQMEDMKYKVKRMAKNGETPKHGTDPLYTSEDATNTGKYYNRIEANTCVELGDGISACWHEAGHILGACSIKITINQGDETRTILFSGDIGRWDAPILNDPTLFDQADYVLTESTYGNRYHEAVSDIKDKLADAINDTIKRGGNIIIPSFAVERSQDILYYMSELRAEKRIPDVLVFLDSPMAVKVTHVFRENPQLFDEATMQNIEDGIHPVDFKGLVLSRSVAQSKAINRIKGSAIVIAGSGMCTGGRIKHHLKSNISRPESTVLFVGYQAHGTLGRHILEKNDDVRIFGEKYKVRAKIEKINGFSGHADKKELFTWISNLKSAPRRVFVTHGEEKVALHYAEYINEKLGYDTHVPEYREVVELD